MYIVFHKCTKIHVEKITIHYWKDTRNPTATLHEVFAQSCLRWFSCLMIWTSLFCSDVSWGCHPVLDDRAHYAEEQNWLPTTPPIHIKNLPVFLPNGPTHRMSPGNSPAEQLKVKCRKYKNKLIEGIAVTAHSLTARL